MIILINLIMLECQFGIKVKEYQDKDNNEKKYI